MVKIATEESMTQAITQAATEAAKNGTPMLWHNHQYMNRHNN